MNTKKYGALLGATLATIAVMALGSTTVSAVAPAQVAEPTGPTANCTGDSYDTSYVWPGAGYNQHATGTIVSTHGWLPESRTISVSLGSGVYDVDAVGYDGGPQRASDPAQPSEQYLLDFLNGSGNVIASTGPTGDLLDGVNEATWSGTVGQIDLSEAVTQIRAIHLYAGQVVPGAPNSVMPVCVGLTLVPPPPPPTSSTAPTTTTTAAPTTTTTAAPTTTTTAAPTTTTTAAPTTTTTAAPTTTTTTAPTTTTIPTQVEGAIEVAPTAEPSGGSPTFTG